MMEKHEIRTIVSSALDKVYNGNTRENIGEIENHSTEYTHKHYSLLAKGDENAVIEQKKMFEKIRELDVDKILKDINE